MSFLESDYSEDFDEDMVSIRPEGSRVKKVLIALTILVLISLLLFVVVRGWIDSQLDPAGEPAEDVQVLVESGATTGDIASQLEEADIVPNSFFFRYYTQWNNEGDFQAGEYTFKKNMSAEEAVEVLKEGPQAIEVVTIQVKEGKWVSEILTELAEQLPNVTEQELQEVLDSGQLEPRYRPDDQPSWEGYLFPNTYEVERDTTALEVLGILNNEFARVAGDLGYGSERPNNLSPYEVLIVASLIEAEAKTEEDRSKIARVIYNRLDDNVWLDVDATLIYGNKTRGEPPTKAEILTPGPYNTRAPEGIRGLPPTPIAVPSKASLAAAMNPAEGNWLYYVLADEQGNHFFTEDFDEFNSQKAISGEKGLL